MSGAQGLHDGTFLRVEDKLPALVIELERLEPVDMVGREVVHVDTKQAQRRRIHVRDVSVLVEHHDSFRQRIEYWGALSVEAMAWAVR